MEYYLLEESMRSCTAEELHGQSEHKYVAVLTTPEWQRERDRFDMGIELEPDVENIHNIGYFDWCYRADAGFPVTMIFQQKGLKIEPGDLIVKGRIPG